MELRITDKDGILDITFAKWLSKRIQIRLVSNFRKFDFSNWEQWLNETDNIKRLYDKKYTVYELVTFASKNIVYYGTNGELTIGFNNNVFVPGFDRWKLSSCIKTLNFGTLQIKGCPIFTKTLDEFANDIDIYVSNYYIMGG